MTPAEKRSDQGLSLGIKGAGIYVPKEVSKTHKPKAIPKPLKVSNSRK